MNLFNFSENRSFWLAIISIFIILIVPVLIKDGMFMDGQQYSCVSMNLANGLGSFWFPFLNQTWHRCNSIFFMEHPPLVYWLQSLFFNVLGYGMYTERIYSFLAAIANAFIISLIWKLIFHDEKEIKKMSWLPILFWIIIPVCFWSFQNNMMENTMGIFTSLSVFFSLKGLTGNKKHTIIYLLVSGVFIFLASFSKGVPGFFPLVVPFICWFTYRNISFIKSALFTFILFAVPVIIYSLLIINDNAYESLRFYLFERVLCRISEDVTAESHFYIIYRLFCELIPGILLCTIFFFIFKRGSPGRKYFFKNINSLLFFLIGTAGSLPIMLTMAQKSFYFVPSLAFFALSLAILVAPGIKQLVSHIDCRKTIFRIFFIFSVALFIFSFSYSALQIGKASRDSEMLSDVYKIGKTVPQKSILNSDKKLFEKWNLQFYLYRYFLISIDPTYNIHQYYLGVKESSHPDTAVYKKILLQTQCYDLYKLKDTVR